MQEILAGKKKDDNDPLLLWLDDAVIKKALLLDEKIDPDVVNTVVEVGYADDLTDDELEEIGRDPFLIAYGIVGGGERCVVTIGASKPSKKRQNRKVPAVCETFGLPCCNPFKVNRDLGFKTGWKE
jgi:hypothetical protein